MVRTTTTIKSLTQGFAQHIRELKSPSYKERQLRDHYLDPFWQLLGWDVDNSRQLAPQDIEVQIEPSMESAEDSGMRSREPDYLFRLNGFPRFIVEAKKPSVDIDFDRNAIYQAKRYAWNAQIPFAILTDFEQFRLYDATLKPILAEPTRGLIEDFTISFQDYPDKWEVLMATFGREAVAAGSLEKLYARIKKVRAGRRIRTVDRMLVEMRGVEPVDRVFLDYLEKFREHFAHAIYRENKAGFPEADTPRGAARLTEAVQRLIDRIVFMRVCEDRGVAPYGKLRDMLERIGTEGGDFYQSLCAEFRELDREYNGYLYKFHWSEALDVPGNVLADFVRTLYPPDGPWDFAKISDDILGIVYERFLGHTITVKKGQVHVEEKIAVRHAGGVYYTPRFVVDTIIRRVVGPKVAGKTPTELLDIKILDPACGSGSFLVAAFQYLIDHCLRAIEADPALAKVPATPRARKKRKEIAFQDDKGRWHLAPDFKAALLTSCIHGVDIDQQAVEVTVMSLYLKMLEGKLPKDWQRDWLENELLPSLDPNILCGNSLINHGDYETFAQRNRAALFGEDKDLAFRINRFDWESRTRGFGRILDADAEDERGRRGFDCIIGNPPYIRVQELNQWAPEECEFYKWKYKSAGKGNYDIYVVFTEKALSLLAPEGLLGFIMPNKWWHSQYGSRLRDIIAKGRNIRSVIDFTDQQVFTGATTYTAIHVLQASGVDAPVDVTVVTELTDGTVLCRAIDSARKKSGAGYISFQSSAPQVGASWVFRSTKGDEWCRAVSEGNPRLVDIAPDIFVGLQTSADTVFVFEDFRRSGKLVVARSTELGVEVELEQELLRPVVRSGQIGAHWANPTAVVLFPYQVGGGRAVIIPVDAMKSEFPLAWKYLKRNETLLRGRESGKFDHAEWYGLMRKNLERWETPKVMVPYMITRLCAWYDRAGDHYFVNVTTGGFGIRTDKVNMRYLAALLSSTLLDRWFKSQAGRFHSGYFGANKLYLENLPIKLPETKEEKKLAERIIESVERIMADKKRLRSPRLSDRERSQLEGEVEHHEKRIDEAVFELYGVKRLPI